MIKEMVIWLCLLEDIEDGRLAVIGIVVNTDQNGESHILTQCKLMCRDTC